MTRAEFIAWLKGHARPTICVEEPYDIQPCACRDINCRGWRLVSRAE